MELKLKHFACHVLRYAKLQNTMIYVITKLFAKKTVTVIFFFHQFSKIIKMRSRLLSSFNPQNFLSKVKKTSRKIFSVLFHVISYCQTLAQQQRTKN